jgi:hypothetical protein
MDYACQQSIESQVLGLINMGEVIIRQPQSDTNTFHSRESAGRLVSAFLEYAYTIQ